MCPERSYMQPNASGCHLGDQGRSSISLESRILAPLIGSKGIDTPLDRRVSGTMFNENARSEYEFRSVDPDTDQCTSGHIVTLRTPNVPTSFLSNRHSSMRIQKVTILSCSGDAMSHPFFDPRNWPCSMAERVQKSGHFVTLWRPNVPSRFRPTEMEIVAWARGSRKVAIL